MALTYIKRSFHEVEEVKKEIRVPKKWGMFSYFGNKRITDLARKFYKVADTDGGLVNCTIAGIEFIKKYREMEYKSKHYSEAGDTEVRESVWDFFEKVCNAIGINADSIWDCKESQESIHERKY